MNFKDLVKSRYSCRNFSAKAVSYEIINDLFEICRYAPSAVNIQPWEFIVVTDNVLLKKVFESYDRSWFKTAPIVIIALGDKQAAWVRSDGKNHSDIDLSIIIDHFTLAATDKGLATCWVCNFDVSKIRNLFDIPKLKEIVALIPLGFPADTKPQEKKRKKTNDFLYYNSYLND